eukprot:snap_masked-scaffold_12-processed-gene-11.50-mRNA-1 protein AED:1.00 eAED:1.00 QI:0/0/0/0/1/1/3/0/426
MEQEKDNSKEVGSQMEPEESADVSGQEQLGGDASSSGTKTLLRTQKRQAVLTHLQNLLKHNLYHPRLQILQKPSSALGTLPFSTLDEVTRICREARKLETQKAALEDMHAKRQSELEQRELELFLREKNIDELLPGQLAAKKQQEDQFKKLNEWQDRLNAKELELLTIEENINSFVQESNQVTEAVVDKKPLETPAEKTPSIPDKLSQFNEPTPSNQLLEDTDKDQKSVKSLSAYDKWSETGSSYVDRDKYKKRYQPPMPPAYPTSNTNQGFPLVQVQLPIKLKQLTEKKIENFLHEYRNTVRNVPAVSVQSLLSKNVADELEQRGVDIDSSEAILRYLTRHLLNFEKSKRLKCLTRLENDSKWPGSNFDAAEQIYLFFDQAFQILKHLDEGEIKSHKKKILRKVIDRIPREFGVQYQEFTLISGG